ncbi:hypothetical protein Tco_0760563 [Tanacetum coccineum]
MGQPASKGTRASRKNATVKPTTHRGNGQYNISGRCHLELSKVESRRGISGSTTSEVIRGGCGSMVACNRCRSLYPHERELERHECYFYIPEEEEHEQE